MAGRPRINEGGNLIGVGARISREDLELLKELGYNPGQVIREFCNQKRRTKLAACSDIKEVEKKLEETEKTLNKVIAEKADLLNQVEQIRAAEAENVTVKDNIEECKRVTVNRLYENREIIKRRGPGYKEKINYCISAMPAGSITADQVLDFFESYGKNLPKLNDFEFLLY